MKMPNDPNLEQVDFKINILIGQGEILRKEIKVVKDILVGWILIQILLLSIWKIVG